MEINSEFFNAVANWADRQKVVVTFERDEHDGWFAKVWFSDSRGPYSRVVDQRGRMSIVDKETGKNRVETSDEYAANVERTLNLACTNAHKSRQRRAA